MDPILTANLKAVTAAEATRRNDRRTFEQKKLREQRTMRGQLLFLDRMQNDASSKRAYGQVCALREDPAQRAALDRAILQMRPPPALTGPTVVTHDRRAMSQ